MQGRPPFGNFVPNCYSQPPMYAQQTYDYNPNFHGNPNPSFYPDPMFHQQSTLQTLLPNGRTIITMSCPSLPYNRMMPPQVPGPRADIKTHPPRSTLYKNPNYYHQPNNAPNNTGYQRDAAPIAPSQSTLKREKKALLIINPDTGVAIDTSSLAHQSSKSAADVPTEHFESAKLTEQDDSSGLQANIFAAKVVESLNANPASPVVASEPPASLVAVEPTQPNTSHNSQEEVKVENLVNKTNFNQMQETHFKCPDIGKDKSNKNKNRKNKGKELKGSEFDAFDIQPKNSPETNITTGKANLVVEEKKVVEIVESSVDSESLIEIIKENAITDSKELCQTNSISDNTSSLSKSSELKKDLSNLNSHVDPLENKLEKDKLSNENDSSKVSIDNNTVLTTSDTSINLEKVNEKNTNVLELNDVEKSLHDKVEEVKSNSISPPPLNDSKPVESNDKDPVPVEIPAKIDEAVSTTQPIFLNIPDGIAANVPVNSEIPDKKRMRLIKNQYNYSEEQWSPLNPEGRKHYDRNFLYQFQFSDALQKPALAPLECVLNKPLALRQDSFQQSGSSTGEPSPSPDFTPGFILGTMNPSSGRPVRRGPNSIRRQHSDQAHHHQQQPQQQRKIISLNIQSDIQLHTVDNAWKLKKEEMSESEIVYNKVRAILNKLTPQMFQTLVEQVRHLPINTEQRLIKCIDIIFEKAISEPNFSVAYANMARCLMQTSVPTEEDPKVAVSFRKLLITKCQVEFEKDKLEEADIASIQQKIDQATNEEEIKLLTEEKSRTMWKAKRRSLGNIRFIGELFKLKLLKEKIMHECLQKLIQSNDEDNLECLCQLLTTIGMDIDTQESKRAMESYFVRLTQLSTNKSTSHRIKFMILDIIDLRKNHWVPRHEKNNPKTIEQIHQEAKQEEMEKQLMIQKAFIDPNYNKRRNDRPIPPIMSQSMEDGWTSVSRPPKNIPMDMTKIRISKPNMDENIQLGPSRSMGTWQQGSSGGASLSKNQETTDRSTPNRFSALYSSNSESLDGRSAASPIRDQMASRGEYKGRMSGPYLPSAPRASIHQRPSQERNKLSSKPQDNAVSIAKLPPSSAAPLLKKQFSVEESNKKTKSLIDEFLQIHDYKEASECFEELVPHMGVSIFIETSHLHVLDRTEIARHQVGLLFSHLLRHGNIKIADYLPSISSIVKLADDMVIDVPRTWEYLGELVSPIFLPHNTPSPHNKPPPIAIRLEALKNMQPPSIQIAILIAHILQQLAHRLGHRAAFQMWFDSSIYWQDFMPEDQVPKFIKEHHLEFLLDRNEFASPRQSVGDPIDELLEIFKCDSKKIEDVQDWIDSNMAIDNEDSHAAKLVSSIFVALCTSCFQKPSLTIDMKRLKKFIPVIQNLVTDESRQVEILFGLQQFVHTLEHPAGLLSSIFGFLFDEDVIAERAFRAWKLCSDADRLVGKGVALSSVNQFFDFLDSNDDADS